MGFFERLINEVTNMDLANFLMVALIFYVPYYFSKKAHTLFFHITYSAFGIYMLLTLEDLRVIYDIKMLVGLGLLIPQISFLRWFIPHSIQSIKMMTANTYYFFITIYYKVIRFITWVKNLPNTIKIFFTTFSFKNFSKEDTFKKDEYTSSYNQEESFYNEKQSENESYTNYEEKTSYTQEEQQTEVKKDYGEYAQFYSNSAYIVLGVNQNDNFKTIKKSYKTLIRIYHPDLNPDDIKQFTEITQNLNSAYEKLEKIHS